MKRYLPRLPKQIPKGQVLFHNSVVPTRTLNWRGFRAWLDKPDADYGKVLCRCGWAPELGKHYMGKAFSVLARRPRTTKERKANAGRTD